MSVAGLIHSVIALGPVGVDAYDGSHAGPDDAVVRLEVRSPRALGYLLTAPGELGLARAYVTGQLDVQGDMHTALSAILTATPSVGWRQAVSVATAVRPHMFKELQRPPEEVRMRGRRHSKSRDAAAIAHHYDVSNRFYELILGPSMAYTCAVYPDADATLEQAQAEKFDLVCRKLGLQPGQRLLDVGCGWGGMVLHATKHYGVTALGVTLSERQAAWGKRAVEEAGLSDRAEIRHSDYRDVAESGFDAVSSIGLTEHIGKANLDSYFTFLADRLRPEGRLLNHCIMRPTTKQPSSAGRFIGRYVFPDGELEGLGTITTAMQDNGFEVWHEENLREHYALTLRDWGRNLDANWDEAVAQAGIGRARVWRLYMAATRLGFEQNWIQLHQLLGTKTDRGRAGMPLRPSFERSLASIG